ncbi:tetratricopeptide repeat protein, partial [Streptomyces brasiliscabiei]
ERALAITEAALGPDHPDTAKCLNNLAEIQRRLEQANRDEAL